MQNWTKVHKSVSKILAVSWPKKVKISQYYSNNSVNTNHTTPLEGCFLSSWHPEHHQSYFMSTLDNPDWRTNCHKRIINWQYMDPKMVHKLGSCYQVHWPWYMGVGPRGMPLPQSMCIYKESPSMWKYSAKYLTLSYKFKELDRKMKFLVSRVLNITEQWELTEIYNFIVKHNFIT